MEQNAGGRLYSATDLVNFLGCSHNTALDLEHIGRLRDSGQVADEYVELLKNKGLIHEHVYLETLRAQGLSIAEIDDSKPTEERVDLTRRAMARGVDIIYQGALLDLPWRGYSDFLKRVNGRGSILGDYGYEVLDTKLSRAAQPKHAVQLAIYSTLVAREQQLLPHEMHLVLGNGAVVSLRVTEFLHYCEIARGRFETFAAPPPKSTVAEPCGHCALCRWNERCVKEWDEEDHLSLVANITRGQRKKLIAEGITTIRQLASIPDGQRIQRIKDEALTRIRVQARLQVGKRDGGPSKVETLPLQPLKGFARLPRPDDGDLFFDMEGDPLVEDGLEYLFGFNHLENGKEWFTPFWAHDRVEEKKAFQDAVDFITARLAKHPGAHIYHYAAYEESALVRLAMSHGTREEEIDDLLRGHKLVDLYKAVKESVQVSEPRYSLKNIEVFFADERSEEVKNAGDSIVVYERWCELGDPRLLQQIVDYNEVDCSSTRKCRDWLLSLRPAEVEWFTPPVPADAEKAATRSEDRRQAEEQRAALQSALLAGVDAPDLPWRELLGNLLEFHHREAKPEWREMFSRQNEAVEVLVDDAACIGGLTPDSERPPRPEKRSVVHSFRFEPQDFKMGVGDKPLRSETLEPAGEIVELDEESCRIALKLGPKRSPFGSTLSLIPPGPLGDQLLRDAVYRYAESVAAGDESKYEAVTAVLRRAPPRVRGVKPGEPILSDGDLLAGCVKAVCSLESSYLLVQGPPGTGKTFKSSHAIVELLAAGKRVGVASHSHKAINVLLSAVETAAAERGIRFRGAKKSGSDDQFLNGIGMIADITDSNDMGDPTLQLVAGTAWLFAQSKFDQAFDYLFIDEAGQVSLANVVAMALSARNLVLVGDQMQLSQPTRGFHPGGSGASALEHLLGDHATVPEDKGIFLSISRRLHPALCEFISDAIYDGRLDAAEENSTQRVVLAKDTGDEGIAPFGLRFVEVNHEANDQKSKEEAIRLKQSYDALLSQRWVDRAGKERPLGINDILVVTPYNMQVNLLKSSLPPKARVGTVDKFQGQEAAVVLISMATSSGEDIPRNIEFLFSRNRLNVAISRAQCLAVVFASPRLLEVSCNTIEQMRLVNTLCWAKTFADDQRAGGEISDGVKDKAPQLISQGAWSSTPTSRQGTSD